MTRARTPLFGRFAVSAMLAMTLLAAGCSNFSEVAEIINPTREALVGGITVSVAPGWEPDISFSGTQPVLAKSSSMTVSASVSPAPDCVEWYVDDVLSFTQNAAQQIAPFTFGTTLKTGQHSVSLIARKGSAVASAQFQFKVILAFTQ